jgi:predicted esterase YcpF (UPF0227 family)
MGSVGAEIRESVVLATTAPYIGVLGFGLGGVWTRRIRHVDRMAARIPAL